MAAFKEHGAHVLVGTPGRLHDVFERSDVLDARRLEVHVFPPLLYWNAKSSFEFGPLHLGAGKGSAQSLQAPVQAFL